MQYHAIPCNAMQYNAIPCNTLQYHAIPCNAMQYHAIPCNTMQCYARQCNTMQYHAIPCIINNCWRSVPLPCGQYKAIFSFKTSLSRMLGCVYCPLKDFLYQRFLNFANHIIFKSNMMCGYNVLHNQIIFSLLVALPALSRKNFLFRTHIEERWCCIKKFSYRNLCFSSHFEVIMWLAE